MASIPKSQAESESTTAQDTLVDAANQRFIDAADAQIQEAIDQGEFFINCQTWEDNIDPRAIFDYYSGLGYAVSFPDYPTNQMLQPAELFGQFWINFWTNGNVPISQKKPLRLLIAWN